MIKRSLWKIILSLLPILAILLLAGYLRLYRIADYMTFLGDEGRDVLVVKRMIVDGKFTLLGPTASVGGFFMGPIYYYFMLPFLWAWNLNPVGPAVMVALFGIATVFLVYYAGIRWFSKPVALIASLLYAISPIIIAYSRSSWNPNIVPFFALVSLYLLWLAKEKNNFQLLFWVGICAGIGVQLHYSYLFLIITQVILVAWSYKQIKNKDILVGIGGFILGFSPFLAFEFRHGFTNSRSIMEFVFAGKDTGFVLHKFVSNIQDVTLRLFGRFLLRIPEVGALGNMTPSVRDPWKIGQSLLAVGGVVALIIYGLRAKKERNASSMNTFIFFLCWFLVPLIFFGIYKKNIYDYYFGIFFPLSFYLVALLITDIMKIRYIGKIIAAAAIVGLFLFNWAGRPFLFEPNRQLAQVELISRSVIEKTEGKPFNFALITPGNSDHAYRYFFEIWNKHPVVIENSVIDAERKTVTNQLLIVCEDIFCQPLGNSLWEVAGFGRAEIAGVWDVSVVKIYKLIHYVEPKL
jgi:4-amino-4-deoxy-L-arabinose transferase-like glycosyltransferase